MLHQALLIGFIVCYATEQVYAQQAEDNGDLYSESEKIRVHVFSKSQDRVLRSATECLGANSSRTVQATCGSNVTLTCSCKGSGNTEWYDEKCSKIKESERTSLTDNDIAISSIDHNSSLIYICKRMEAACSERIDIMVENKIPTSSKSGAGAVVVVVIIAVVIVVSLCYVRKKKAKVSLCFRDTFRANDGRDGKVFDAYVSTGYTEIDRKFIEGFIGELLQKKYRYKLVTDNKNILPKLDYSPKLSSNIHQCRRLIVIFSPSYMTHDWCMYCFNEGLRKIADLNIPTIFVITDHTMRAELYAHNDVISHIPQVLLTQYQSPADKEKAIEKIRGLMPPPMKSSVSFKNKNGMRSPIMSDAESIHRSEQNLNGTSHDMENGTEYTFGVPPQQISEEIEREYDEALEEPGPDDFVTAVQGGEVIDPEKVTVNQYGARKDFYSLTMDEGDV